MGVALAVPYVLYGRGARVFAAGLIVAAAIYVVFAATRGTFQDVLLELGGVAVFGTLAVLGLRRPLVLATGWALHVSWDVLLHPIGDTSYAPWWYPVLCIGFDLVVAAAILRLKIEGHGSREHRT